MKAKITGLAKSDGHARNALSYVLGLAIVMCLLNFAVLSFEGVFYRFQPASYFFSYSKIESEKKEYYVEEPSMLMRSVSQWKREISKAEWVDALYCDFLESNQWTFIGNQSVSAAVAKTPSGDFVEMWELSVKLPSRPASCKVISVIDINIKGYNKSQTIESNVFLVKSRQPINTPEA